MKSLRDDFRTELVWSHEKKPKRLELRVEGDPQVYATLTQLKGSLYLGESADGTWTFKRAGFLRPRIVIRVSGSEADLGALHIASIGDGRLELGGKAWPWHLTSFWHQERAFLGAGDEPLVRIRPEFSGRIHVTLAESARRLPEAPLMALLGAHAVQLMADDVGGAMAAAAAAAASA